MKLMQVNNRYFVCVVNCDSSESFLAKLIRSTERYLINLNGLKQK